MSPHKSKPEDFAPKGAIAPVLDALSAFAPKPKWKLPDETTRSFLKEIATDFNRDLAMQRGEYRGTLEGKAVRLPDMIRELENLQTAADAYAKALINLNPYSVAALVRDAQARERTKPDEYESIDATAWRVYPAWRDGTPKPAPKDDASVAFSSEIETPKWLAGNTPDLAFLNPSIARAVAVARLANAKAKEIRTFGKDTGGDSHDLTAQFFGKAKYELVTDSFWLISAYFGENGTKKCTATEIAHKSPFLKFIYAMFEYATGEYADGTGDSNFEAPIKQLVPKLRDQLTIGYEMIHDDGTTKVMLSWSKVVGQPFPLRDEIEALNNGDMTVRYQVNNIAWPVLLCADKKTAKAASQRFPDHIVAVTPKSLLQPGKTDWMMVAARGVLIWRGGSDDAQEYAEKAAEWIRKAGATSVDIVSPDDTVPPNTAKT